jgi:hypothetical protein
VKRPSKTIILEWIKEWAEGGNESGWSPYKSVVVNWGRKGETYYYKLADRGLYDVRSDPDYHGDHLCGGKSAFWKVANMWDRLLQQKMRSMEDDIEDIPGLTWHQRRVLRRSLNENYDAALREKAQFWKLRNASHTELELGATIPRKPTATVHRKPAATAHKKQTATLHKKPAAAVSKRASVCKKPASGC